MMAHGRVVVGVDSAGEFWLPLSWALAEADRTGRHLVICHACPSDSPLAPPTAGTRISLLELIDPGLARAVAAARLRLGGDRVTVLVRPQPPGDLLVATAGAADLLVVGAPTRPGWLERGSTTRQVVRHAVAPVVVVRPATRPAGGAHPMLAGHVVVGVDGRAPARPALEFGFGYAAEHRLPLAGVHVAARVQEDFSYDDTMRQLHLAVEPEGLRLLGEELEPWQHKYPQVRVERAVYGGRPLAGLLRASIGAVLLCVGDSGRRPASRVVGAVTHGSVAHESVTYGVVERAPCAAAIVREVGS